MRACLVLFWLLFMTTTASALQGIGGVVVAQGDVTVVRAGTALPAEPGMTLEVGDRVVTGRFGRALLQLEGGLTVTVARGTELVLAELGVERGQPSLTAWLDLLKGLVRAVLTAPETRNDVQIRTPVAVTSVRSTEWTVEHEPAHTAVFCRNGSVAVEAAGQTVTLAAGDGTDVRGDAPPTAPVAWGAPRVERTLARTSLARP